VILNASAVENSEIHISGGQRGLNLRLPTADFISLTGAKLAAIC
jgi:Cys-tRNA(Pro)/Cys-tRNA(Cys) deacylase